MIGKESFCKIDLSMDRVIKLNNFPIHSDEDNQEIAKGNLSLPNKELKCDICDRTFDIRGQAPDSEGGGSDFEGVGGI